MPMSATGSEPRYRYRSPRACRGSAGFTLLEMLCVLLLVASMVTMTGVAVQHGLAGARAQAAAAELASGLRRARWLAVSGGRTADFTLDLSREAYRVDGEPMVALPTGLHMGMHYARDTLAATSGTEGAIRFFPDGSSTGGRITLRQGRRLWRLDVSWLTGGVTLAAATEP